MSAEVTSSEKEHDQPKSARSLRIALFVAVFVAFSVSGGFVLARQRLIASRLECSRGRSDFKFPDIAVCFATI